MNKIFSIDSINKNDFILQNILYLKLKKIDSQFYGMNSQYLKSTKLAFFPIKSSYFNFFEIINLFLDEIISVDFFLNFLTEEEFNDDPINLFNLKLHFLVLLKKKKRAGTKY